MTSKELSKLIREFVRKEVEHQKAEIIKEVKAEMFDVIMGGSPTSSPQLQTESIKPQSPAADMTRAQLREMFQQNMGMDTMQFNTSNVLVNPAAPPASFKAGAVGEKHKDVLEAMNKDYGSLMKKMGI
jgi:hypothetical protein